jgi:2-keto-3-deoxy-L-rhamnonate aldolase RhmA
MGESQGFKSKLEAGKVCVGSWIAFTDPTSTEIMCGSGFDFLIVDAEHGPHDLQTVQMHMMATKGTNTTPLVRVAWNDQVLIKRLLDVGAAGVLVPMIRTREDVKQAIAACMYPPAGVRGFGPRRPSNYERNFSEYIATSNDEVIVLVQIEHIDAVNNLDEILQAPGLSGVFVGSNDLSASIGLLGQPRHPRVLELIDTVIAKARAAGIPPGIAGPSAPEAVLEWISKGMQFITCGGDGGFLLNTADSTMAEIRRRLEE